MIITPIRINSTRFDYQSALEECVDEAEIFFKNQGMKNQIAKKLGYEPKEFLDAVHEYFNTKFNSMSDAAIRHSTKIQEKYLDFFKLGKGSYRRIDNELSKTQ